MIQNYNSAELAALVIAAVAAIRKAVPQIDGWRVAALAGALAIALVLFATPTSEGAVAIVQRILVVFSGSYGAVAAAQAIAAKAAPKLEAPRAETVAVERVDKIEVKP